MAVLLLLLAVAGGALVGDLVLENTAPGSVTVLDRSLTLRLSPAAEGDPSVANLAGRMDVAS